MKDLIHIQKGQFYGKRDASKAKPLPITRVRCLPANKYSARFMETVAAADVAQAAQQYKEAHEQ